MAIETAANTMATTTQQALTTATGSVKVFLLAHPVGKRRGTCHRLRSIINNLNWNGPKLRIF